MCVIHSFRFTATDHQPKSSSLQYQFRGRVYMDNIEERRFCTSNKPNASTGVVKNYEFIPTTNSGSTHTLCQYFYLSKCRGNNKSSNKEPNTTPEFLAQRELRDHFFTKKTLCPVFSETCSFLHYPTLSLHAAQLSPTIFAQCFFQSNWSSSGNFLLSALIRRARFENVRKS